LGVLSLYLAAGHKKQQNEISFLKRVAEVLALGVSRIQAEKKLQFLAYHNDLTKLPNRLLLLDRLRQLILLGKRQVFYSAIIYINFDRFSKINDLFGNSVGDALLIEIAQRFNCIVRHEDTLAHLGEDQFAILMTHIKANHNQAMHDIQTLIHRLQLIIADDFQIGGHELMITFCVGIVVNDACKNPDNLLRQAKTAMYQA